MLPKSIASCIVSQGFFWSPIIIFKVRKVQFRSLLHILSIYLFNICLVNILLFGMELLQDSANERLMNCEETDFQGQAW